MAGYARQRWKILADEKFYVQNQFKPRLVLNVDEPRSGRSGISYNGNFAKKFFKDSDILTEITSLNRDSINRGSKVFQALSSG